MATSTELGLSGLSSLSYGIGSSDSLCGGLDGHSKSGGAQAQKGDHDKFDGMKHFFLLLTK